MKRIYLDNAATTPLHPEAKAAMMEWVDGGNPSSLYAEGRSARAAIDRAREQVSAALGADFADVVFTSGGTEAANLAILGVALGNENRRRNRVILGAGEHHCVLHTQTVLERLGYGVDLLTVDREAVYGPDGLGERLGEDVLLVSLMHANNELGTIQPIAALAEAAHRFGAVFHCDAVQTFLKQELPWTADSLGADLVSVSSHKVRGPKAVGALYVRAGVKLRPLVGGGGQEREMRGGTENLPGIVGFGAAVASHIRSTGSGGSGSAGVEDVRPSASAPKTGGGRQPSPRPSPLGSERENSGGAIRPSRDRFEQGLIELGAIPTVTTAPRLSGHVHVRFPGRNAGILLISLDRAGISASAGAACSSGSSEPSHVLLAAGYSVREAKEGIRFTLGPDVTDSHLEEALDRIEGIIKK